MRVFLAAGDALFRAALAVALASGLLYVSYAVSVVLLGIRGTVIRLAGTLTAAAILASALFHVLASVGMFRIGPATMAVAAIAAAAGLTAHPRVVAARRWDSTFLRRVAARLTRSPGRLAAIGAALLVWPGLVRAVFLPPAGWDALTYHVIKPAMWIQDGAIGFLSGPGPWNYYAHFPAGGEVFMAWAMLPVRADTLVPLVDGLSWVGLGVVLFALARELGVREPFGSAAVAVVLAMPTVRLLVGAAYVELALVAALVAGLALGLAACRGRPWSLPLALGALGVTGAIKAPAIVLGGALAAALLAAAVRQVGTRVLVTAMAAYLAGALPWMAWAAARTGAPLSPVPLNVAGIAVGVAPPELDWYMSRSELRAASLRDEVRTLRQIVRLPTPGAEGLGAAILVPFALFVPGLVHLSRHRARAAALLSLCVLVNLIYYYSDGFLVVRRLWPVSSARFLLPVAAVAAVVSVAWCRAHSRWAAGYLTYLRAAALLTLAANAVAFMTWLSTVLVLAGTAVVAAVVWAVRRTRPGRARILVAAALAVVAAAGLDGVRDALRPRLLMETALHPVPRYWVDAATALDEPGLARTIAMTSGPWQDLDNWFAAPFVGRRLQNRVVHVPVARDGRVRPFGDETARAEYDRTADRDAWMIRLAERGVTHVMSFAPRSIELDWMEQSPARFRREHGRPGEWGLFAVLPEPAR